MLMEETSVILSDRREVILDDEDIIISMKRDDEILHTFKVPFPSAGYGGGMLMLSPSERYLVFSYYSGQSEEAYILLEIQDSCLEFTYGSDYLYGEGASIMAATASVFHWFAEKQLLPGVQTYCRYESGHNR